MDRSASKRRRNARIIPTAVVLLACASLGRATYARQGVDGTLSVCTHGCKFHNIQRAIDKARSGDTIDIGPGTYFENVVIDGKDLILTGASSDETTIDGDLLGPVFTLSHAAVTLTGLTITHGKGETGGGLSIIGSDLELTDVIVVSNVASQGGGGIYLQIGDHSTSLTSNRCVITHNRAPQGAGIYDTVESHLDLVDSTVANNDAELDGGGLFFEYATTPNITRTTISDNSAGRNGGGIWAAHGNFNGGEPGSHVSLDHSAVVNNTAAQAGGGIYQSVIRVGISIVLLDGSIISLNTPDDVGSIVSVP